MIERAVQIVQKTKKMREKKIVEMKGIYMKQVNNKNVNKFKSSGKIQEYSEKCALYKVL